jgi:hypothetical protein
MVNLEKMLGQIYQKAFNVPKEIAERILINRMTQCRIQKLFSKT